MIFSRYGKFTGGIDLPEEKAATLTKPIEPLDTLHRLEIPLSPCGALPAEPVVPPGQRVAPGERLAITDGSCVDLFSPVDAVVRGFDSARVLVGREIYTTPVMVLEDIAAPPTLDPPEISWDWEDADAETLRERIEEGQLLTRRRSAEPLRRWVHRAVSADVNHLVINGMENQPFLTAHHRLLAEFSRDCIRGAALLAKAIGAEKITLAVDAQRTTEYEGLVQVSRKHGVQRVALPRKYPIGADRILLKVLTRREIPCGSRSESLGISVTDPSTCLAAWRWIACGHRLAGRVVTISGPAEQHPANRFVPFGTPVRALSSREEGTIVLGGPMLGRVAPADAVINASCEAVLAMEPTDLRPAAQCIRCGWCRDHCPARLNVAMLNDLYELGHIEKADQAGVLSCVGCGVCSYVCPARLPLTERVIHLGRTARQMRSTMPLFRGVRPPNTSGGTA